MLSAMARAIHLRQALSSQQFLDDYYAPSRPVLIAGELVSWPALRLWTPSYLAENVGGASVEVQEHGPTIGTKQPSVSATIPFDTFIGDRSDATSSGTGFASSRIGGQSRSVCKLVGRYWSCSRNSSTLTKAMIRRGSRSRWLQHSPRCTSI